MTKAAIAAEVKKLGDAISTHVGAHGAVLAEGLHEAAGPSVCWLGYLKQSQLTGHCDEMLDGLQATIVEAMGCVALGLARPAIFAMRAQIDCALSWLYFKDHPVEWQCVCVTGTGFKLKGEILEFLDYYVAKFKSRRGLLSDNATRSEVDPYRVLSAHIHGQSSFVLPSFGHLDSLVTSAKRCGECIKLQSEISEYVGDIFLSYFADSWASLPPTIVKAAKARLTGDKQGKFFS